MSCRAFKAATATPQILHHLWISDELLTDAFNRFLRVSHAHRRYGSNVPGPLEARRRLAKRRMGVAAVASSNSPPVHDFGGLFGFGARPPPSFETGWRWQAPMPVPPPARPEKAETSSWPLRQGQATPDMKVHEERVTRFWESPQDSIETSNNAFEALLDGHETTALLDQSALQPVFDFLQSSQNEPEARLTLRLAEWLSKRSTTEDALRHLVAVISQKITLGTVDEAEVSLAIAQLLRHNDGARIIPDLIDALPRSWIQPILGQTTAAILAESENRKVTMESWLASLRGASVFKQSSHHSDQAWNVVYAALSQTFKPSELVEHFKTLDQVDLAMTMLRHWAPCSKYDATAGAANGKYGNAQPSTSIDLDAICVELKELRESKEEYLAQNDAAVDLVAILASHNLPYLTLLEELFAFWQKAKSLGALLDLIQECGQLDPPIAFSGSLSSSLIQPFMQSKELGLAYSAFSSLPNLPLSARRELSLALIEQGQMNSNKVWKIIDRWVEEQEPGVTTFPQELVDIVHEVAYAWARAPHLPARVSFRRVWECYRFLQDRLSPLSPLLTRSLVRAGVVNFVRERKPVPKSRVQYLLWLVGNVEGEHVRKEVDRMIFDYYMMTRKLARYKPAGRLAREKFLGEQTMEDGTVRRVRWKGRVEGTPPQKPDPRKEPMDLKALNDEWEETQQNPGTHLTPTAKIYAINDSENVETPHEFASMTDNEKIIVAMSPSGTPSDFPRAADGLDSAFEAEELAKMASEHRGVSGPELHADDWSSIGETSGNQDAADSTSYPISTAGTIAAMDGGVWALDTSHEKPANIVSSRESSVRPSDTIKIDLSSWNIDPVASEDAAARGDAVASASEDAAAMSPDDTIHVAAITEAARIPIRRTDRRDERWAMVGEITALRRRISELSKKNYDLRLAHESAQKRPKAIEAWVDTIPPRSPPVDHVSNVDASGVIPPGAHFSDRPVSGIIRKYASMDSRRVKKEKDEKQSRSQLQRKDTRDEDVSSLATVKNESPSEVAPDNDDAAKNYPSRSEMRPQSQFQKKAARDEDVSSLATTKFEVSSKVATGSRDAHQEGVEENKSTQPKRHAQRARAKDQVTKKRLKPAWQRFDQQWKE